MSFTFYESRREYSEKGERGSVHSVYVLIIVRDEYSNEKHGYQDEVNAISCVYIQFIDQQSYQIILLREKKACFKCEHIFNHCM